jgi:hypothetical protein
VLLALGRLEQASTLAEQHRTSDPGNALVWLSGCVVACERGHLKEALTLGREARKLDEESALIKGVVYDLKTQLAEGKALGNLLARVGEYESDPAVRLAVEALVYARLGEWQLCCIKALQALEGGAKWPGLIEAIGHSYREMGIPGAGELLLSKFCDLLDDSRPPLARREARREQAREAMRGLPLS